jgi:5-hydroxyisourate hydrolase
VPFLDVLIYRVGLDDVCQHYHLPFKLTAWGVSCFRGGA